MDDEARADYYRHASQCDGCGLCAAFEEFDAIRDSVVKDMIRTAIRKRLVEDIKNGATLPYTLAKAVQWVGQKHFVTGPTKTVWWITISAKDGIDPVAFFKQMEKCREKKGLKGTGTYVLEQRSEDETTPAYGWHIHWLVAPEESGLRKSKVIERVHDCFMRFAEKNAIQVDSSAQEWLQEDRIKYMRGQKAEKKMARVARDRFWREKLGIPPWVEY